MNLVAQPSWLRVLRASLPAGATGGRMPPEPAGSEACATRLHGSWKARTPNLARIGTMNPHAGSADSFVRADMAVRAPVEIMTGTDDAK